MDYIQNIGQGIFESGYKGILRLFTNEFGQEDQLNGVFQPSLLRSGVLDFQEQVHAAYAQYKGSLGDEKNPAWEYNLGIRAEKTINTGTVVSQYIDFGNNYLNIFPTAGATYRFSGEKNIRISYGKESTGLDWGN